MSKGARRVDMLVTWRNFVQSGIWDELVYLVAVPLMLSMGSEASDAFLLGFECSFDYEQLIVTVSKGSFYATS